MSKITLRIPDEAENIHEALKQTAEANHRSLNSEIIHALEYYLAHSPEAKKATEAKKK